MPRLDNGYWSYFTEEEITKIDTMVPDQIWVNMVHNPQLSLRFLHHLVASNNKEKALQVLSSIPDDKKVTYIQSQIDKLPEEFLYYKKTGLRKAEYRYHAFTIPHILLLAQAGRDSVYPTEDSVEKMQERSRISDTANNIWLKLMSL